MLAFVGRRWLLCNKNKIKILYIKKQLKKSLIYGPNNVSGALWALFHLCGPLLAVIGYSMATVGLRGPALAFVGRRWLLCNKNKLKNL